MSLGRSGRRDSDRLAQVAVAVLVLLVGDDPFLPWLLATEAAGFLGWTAVIGRSSPSNGSDPHVP